MIATILLQAGGFGTQQLIMLGAIALVFYFFMIRPQQTKAKEQQAFINSLKEGDKVITAGGVHGKIISVREKTVVVEIDSAKGVRVVFEKTSINKDASGGIAA